MNQPDGFIDPHGGFRNLKSYQMSEIVYDATVAYSATAGSAAAPAPMIKWCRPPAAASRTLPRAACASGTSKKIELKLVGWPAPAWKSCCSTTRIFCGNAICRSGRKTIRRRKRSESSLTRAIGLIGPIGPI